MNLFILSLLALIVGCSPAGESNDKVQPTAIRKKDDSTSELPYLSVERWARRSVLDLAGRLPTPEEILELNEQKERVLFLISSYADTSLHSHYLSSIYPYLLNFNQKLLPDLDRFINQGDTTLEASLTNELRGSIENDVSYQVKNNMDFNLSFQNLFTNNFSIGDTDYLNFWTLNATGNAWLGSDLYYAFYEDSRPRSGILSNQSFLANFDSRQDAIPYSRTYDILKKLSCIDYSDPQAHRFYDVEELDIVGSLRAATQNNKICGSCHAGYHYTSHLFAGVAVGETFGEFSIFTDTPSVLTTRYLGKEISSLEELSELISINPAVHRCQIKKLMEVVFQKSFQSEFDTNTVNIVNGTFKNSDFKLSKILPAIAESSIYRLGPFHSKTDTRQAKSLTGLKFLNQSQWKGIIEQFGFDSVDFEIPTDLNLSQNENTEYRTYFPQGPYWLSIERIVQQFSSAIVNREITTGSKQTDRKIFIKLEDTIAGSQPKSLIEDQISYLVHLFTSLPEDESKDLRKDLYELWSGVKGIDTSIQAHKEAWNVTLIALFLSNQFITY